MIIHLCYVFLHVCYVFQKKIQTITAWNQMHDFRSLFSLGRVLLTYVQHISTNCHCQTGRINRGQENEFYHSKNVPIACFLEIPLKPNFRVLLADHQLCIFAASPIIIGSMANFVHAEGTLFNFMEMVASLLATVKINRWSYS